MANSNYKSAVFSITAKTNMHVGSGNENYGVIDNLVQRDVINDFPTINSSSLKGALRVFCDYKEFSENDMNTIFGTSYFNEDGDENRGKQKSGEFRFFDARILKYPVRVGESLEEIKLPYKMIYCDDVEKEFNESIRLFKCKVKEEKNVFNNAKKVDNAIFKEEVGDYGLPVIARNQLDNGISKNLWYEQVVPRETQFYFTLLYPANHTVLFNNLKNIIEEELVQIGANASIGYGFCEIKQIL